MLKSIVSDPERRTEIARMLGRAFLIVVPVIASISLIAFLVWTFRRQAVTTQGHVVETTEEPPYEVPAEPVTT